MNVLSKLPIFLSGLVFVLGGLLGIVWAPELFRWWSQHYDGFDPRVRRALFLFTPDSVYILSYRVVGVLSALFGAALMVAACADMLQSLYAH